jgi:hypothetical protein
MDGFYGCLYCLEFWKQICSFVLRFDFCFFSTLSLLAICILDYPFSFSSSNSLLHTQFFSIDLSIMLSQQRRRPFVPAGSLTKAIRTFK